MSYGVNAYSKAKMAAVLSPRELEASLLMKGAAKLESAKRDWDNKPDLDEALTYNRRLWTILVTSATDDANPLPKKAKDDFGSLGMFVLQSLISLAAAPDLNRLNHLIEINAMVASGLRN